jgi:hypothetical protein
MDGKTALKRILKKQRGRAWSGFVVFVKGTFDELL